MANSTMATGTILSAGREAELRKPIDEYVGKIQDQIDALRVDGTDKVVNIQNDLDNLKRDRIYTAEEKASREAKLKADLDTAKAVEAKNKDQISKLIADAEGYLKEHYNTDYYQHVVASCKEEKSAALAKYQAAVAQLEKEHQATVAKLTDQQEIKDEKYVHKNRLFDAKMQRDKDLQAVKDRQHAAFDYKYHLIDMLRLSKFTFGEAMAQRWENYKYTFNRRDFLLRNGLYIAIIVIFIALCIITPIVKNVPLLTVNNVLNILQQASPRMFLALGVAGLILLAGTDLSIGRMVGMGMTAATIIMHQGINTGSVFGHVFDFTGLPVLGRVSAGSGGLHRAVHHLHHHRRLLHRQVQDASLHLHHGQHAGHLRSGHLLHQGRVLRRHRDRHSQHDHPQDRRLPHHHSVGRCCGRHRLVHLEQDHLRQEPVRSRRQR